MSVPNKSWCWYEKEFTKEGAALMFVLMLIYLPMHEFGHWIAYWIFGIPAEFGMMVEPFVAFFVQPFVEVPLAIRIFASFFGGGFVFVVAGAIAIKSRPSLTMMVYGLFSGITELLFALYSETYGIHSLLLVQSNTILYLIPPIVIVTVVFALGFPELRWWQD